MAHPDDGISVPYHSNATPEYLVKWNNIANVLNGRKTCYKTVGIKS